MITTRILVPLAALLVVAAGANACTVEPTATVETPLATFYVVNDMCQPDCLFSVWIYQESNGEPGLQRCDEVQDDMSCQCETTDTIVF